MGLGNPGVKYAGTRHNAGFWFIDALAAQVHVRLKQDSRFHGEIGLWSGERHACRLLKPSTYMNHSGVVVSALVRFLRIAVDQILVVHDDLDLPPGTMRLKRGGGHGGHNGLRDITMRLGDGAFARLRIGIGHPGIRDGVVDYVLAPPSPEEHAAIAAGIDAALEVLPLFLAGDPERAMHRLHTRA